jgi:hypothetical protein
MNTTPNLGIFQNTNSHALISVLSMALLLCSNVAFGQAGSKDAQKFQEVGEETREAIVEARGQFESTVGIYNSIVSAEADNPQKAYKDLTKATEKSEKLWADASKSFDKMRKQGDKLFSSWQKDVDAFGSEQMKQVGMQRLELAQTRNQQMIDGMDAAEEAYQPFIISLKDQGMFMARDLSPAAMDALQPLAEELNATAAELLAGIDTILKPEQEGVEEAAEGAAEPAEAEEIEAG